ncbi:MAG: baseplate J/gp47 family protein [Lactococcus lactis]|nr:baseplate J/gp47 family protein [Lactococcus lactis]
MSVGDFLKEHTFDTLMDQALDRVSDDIDKREGSIIYDALAPAMYQLSMTYMELYNLLQDTFPTTAVGEYLDLKALERGLSRLEATKATKLGEFKDSSGKLMDVPISSRFSTVGQDEQYYRVLEKRSDGIFILESESTGASANRYIGDILPVDNFNGLGSAKITDIIIPARSEESDDSLRERMLKNIQILDFGGNIEDYIQFTSKLEGVGAVQVYPIWDGGGTVKVVVLDSQFDIPNGTLLESIQLVISPGKSEKGYGIAPIGHQTTIAAPEKRIVNVSLHVDTIVGKTEEDVKPAINDKINEFFLSLRKTWQDHDEAYRYKQVIYQSQLIASLLFIDGVANISNVTLNGLKEDLALVNNNDLQECPFLGEVTYT